MFRANSNFLSGKTLFILFIICLFPGSIFAQTSGELSGLSHISLTNPSDVVISGNYAYVSDDYSGLRIINISDSANPVLTGTFDPENRVGWVAVSGNYAYVTDYSDGGLWVVDISNPANPSQAGYLDTQNGGEIAVSGNYVYMDTGDLTVIDVSTPSSPTVAGTYDSGGSIWEIFILDNYMYIGNTSSSKGLKIVNISNPASPVETGHYQLSDGVTGLYVSGNYAYIVGDHLGFHIVDISTKSNPALAGSFTMNTPIKIVVEGDFAYIAQASSGISKIDISTPASPVLKSTYTNINYAVDLAISGKYLYSTAYNNGLHILNTGESGGSGGTTDSDSLIAYWDFNEGSGTTVTDKSGNLINGTVTGAAWIDHENFGTALNFSGSNQYVEVLYNAATRPEDQISLSCWFKISQYRNCAVITTTESSGYSIEFDSGLKFILRIGGSYQNVNIAESKISLNEWHYVTGTYNGSSMKIYLDGTLEEEKSISGKIQYNVNNSLLIAAEASSGTGPDLSYNMFEGPLDEVRIYKYAISQEKIAGDMNISTGGSTVTDTTSSDAGSKLILVDHSIEYWGTDAVVSGNYLYYVNSSSGLKIYDVSNPNNLLLKGTFSVNNANKVAISGNYVYLTTTGSGDGGMYIINISDPVNPSQTAFFKTYNAFGIDVSGNYAYIADVTDKLKIVNISNPASPSLTGVFSDPNYPTSVYVRNDTAFVGNYWGGLHIVNISNKSNPVEIALVYVTNQGIYDFCISGNTAYIAHGSDGLKIVDISNPANPVVLGSYSAYEKATTVAVSGNYAWVGDQEGIKLLDISTPSSPSEINKFLTTYNNYSLFLSGHYLYLANTENGLIVFDTKSRNISPEGYWSFNEGSGTTAGDKSLNNLDGTISGAEWKDRGDYGSSLKFDGADDYVIVPYSTANHPVKQITVQCWMKIDEYDSDFHFPVSTYEYGGYRFSFNSSGLQFQVQINKGVDNIGLEYVKINNSDLPAAQWHFITGTFDGFTLKIYLGSELKQEKTFRGSVHYQYQNSLTFGSDVDNGANADLSYGLFKGELDDIRIYDKALAREEIQANMVILTEIDKNGIPAPEKYLIEQNFPNPFNPVTRIRYNLRKPGNVRVTIYNSLGRVVRELVNEFKSAGFFEVKWDGRNHSGINVSSGIYIYRIESGPFSGSKKMLLLK